VCYMVGVPYFAMFLEPAIERVALGEEPDIESMYEVKKGNLVMLGVVLYRIGLEVYNQCFGKEVLEIKKEIEKKEV